MDTAPAPGHPDPAAPQARPPRSTITVPVSVTPAFLRRTLDDVLARLHDEPGLLYRDGDLALGHGLRATVQVHRRGDTRVDMAGDAVTISLPVRVGIRPAWQPQPGGLPLPRLLALPVSITADYTVVMTAHPSLDADYSLRLNATFEHRVDRAVGIEAFGIGLTFSGATRAAAEQALAALGNWLNGEDFHYLDFRSDVARGWQALQQPVPLSPDHQLRLLIEPEGVFAHPFRTENGNGLLGLAIVARLHGMAATRDDDSPAPVPLPPLSGGEPPAGVALALPLTIPFTALEAALRTNVVQHPWQIDGYRVLLRDLHASGTDDGTLQARVDIDIHREGHDIGATLAAAGRPHLDVDGQNLALEDFRYDVHTDSTLLNIAATLLRPFAATILQPWLSLPLQPQAQRLLDEVNARLADGIMLDTGVSLRGTALGIRLSGLHVDAAGLAVTLSTHGTLTVALDHAG